MAKRTGMSPLGKLYNERADALLSQLPGVTWHREISRHNKLCITYKGVTRAVFYPATPRYQRGADQHIGDIKRVLRELDINLQERNQA